MKTMLGRVEPMGGHYKATAERRLQSAVGGRLPEHPPHPQVSLGAVASLRSVVWIRSMCTNGELLLKVLFRASEYWEGWATSLESVPMWPHTVAKR